jgi:hypothetical protein
LYKDWLFYPPIIRTKDDANRVYEDRIEETYERILKHTEDVAETARGSALIEQKMMKYGIKDKLREVIKRFTQEGKPKGWTRYKERAKIKEEIGEPMRKELEEEHTYLVEFQVVQTYQFQAHTKMMPDDLFDYYINEGDENNFQSLVDRVKQGKAVPKGEPEYVDESLELVLLGKGNGIITSRRY